jgi:hypothetical protein
VVARGAWQVGVRMPVSLMLEDISVATGKANRATCYDLRRHLVLATDNLRFMLNYVDTKFDKH